MKKKVIVVLAVVLCLALCLAFTACGNNNAAQGEAASVEGTTWKVSSVTDEDGNKMTGDEMSSVMGEISYEFQADGVLSVTAAGQTIEGTWSQDGNKITIESNGETSEGVLDGEALTFEANGGTTVFVKA
ncbi:MAG: lipocalin family protein [Christensenella sp.]|nr:lipocalin family protein [Christensenella sp.]